MLVPFQSLMAGIVLVIASAPAGIGSGRMARTRSWIFREISDCGSVASTTR